MRKNRACAPPGNIGEGKKAKEGITKLASGTMSTANMTGADLHGNDEVEHEHEAEEVVQQNVDQHQRIGGPIRAWDRATLRHIAEQHVPQRLEECGRILKFKPLAAELRYAERDEASEDDKKQDEEVPEVINTLRNCKTSDKSSVSSAVAHAA
jgi:hypothetical protein